MSFDIPDLRRSQLRIAVCVLTLVPLDASAADEICVYTDRHHAVDVGARTDVQIVRLDAAAPIQVELAAGLPLDPIQAAAMVRERLERGGSDLEHRLREAYQAVADAWSLGITKIPAVVVDRRYVVYGEANVERALALIDHYRKTHP